MIKEKGTNRFVRPSGGVLLVYAQEFYLVNSGNPMIGLMPVHMGVSPAAFREQLRQRMHGISTLCVLRKRLCTSFVQQYTKLFHTGIRAVICYDNRKQMYDYSFQVCDFSEVTIRLRKLAYVQVTEELKFATPIRSPGFRIGHVNDFVGWAREVLDDYTSNYPSWLIAQDIMGKTAREFQIHDLARAIRSIRGREFMEYYPALHELALWVISEYGLDLTRRKDRDDLIAFCSQYMPYGSYLNRSNMDKVIAYIKETSSEAAVLSPPAPVGQPEVITA
jgi:hypothetical protein